MTIKEILTFVIGISLLGFAIYAGFFMQGYACPCVILGFMGATAIGHSLSTEEERKEAREEERRIGQ